MFYVLKIYRHKTDESSVIYHTATAEIVAYILAAFTWLKKVFFCNYKKKKK